MTRGVISGTRGNEALDSDPVPDALAQLLMDMKVITTAEWLAAVKG